MVLQVASKPDLDVQLANAGDKLVVIDFFATWCGPCKQIAPKLEALEGEKSNLIVLKVDVDESEELASFYEITAMPTFIFIKNKEQIDKFTGANFDKLNALVDKHAPA